jgi:putative salt-induced outer membrane protein YdiY
MKRLIIIAFFVLISSTHLISQDLKSEKVKSTISSLFENCKSENMELAAKQIAYMGKDESRNMQGTYNIKDNKEASKVKRIMKKISAFLKISDKYEFGSFNSQTDNGKVVHSIEVLFISGDQKLTTKFSFIEVKEIFLLTDLN